jgi:DNA-binding SARP family transcriptional activator
MGITAPAQRRLLALFVLRANDPVPQDELIDALWNGAAPRTARASLQNLVHAIRRHLGPETVERTPAGYVLRTEGGTIDVERFRRLVSDAQGSSAAERAATLRDALGVWRGPAYAELRGDAWAQGEIGRLDEELSSALEDRIEADLELGRHAALVPELQELVGRDGTRERLWFQLMLALYRSGRQADALAAYRRARDAFVVLLGIEPGVLLRELERAILVQDRALDDPRQALGSTLERAATILPRAPRERAVSLLEYGSALIRIGELHQAATTVHAAARLAETAGEKGLEVRAAVLLSYLDVFADGGSMLQHLTTAAEAARTFEDLGDPGGLAFALLHHAHMLRDTGHAEAALEHALRGAELAAAAGDREDEAACRRMAAYCAALGPTPVSAALALGSADSPSEDDRPLSAWGARAWLLAQSGSVDAARALYEWGIWELRERGIVLNLTVGLGYAGLVERVAGDLDRAAGHVRTAHALVRAQGVRGDLPIVTGELASLLARLGDLDEARHLAEESRRTLAVGDVLSDVLWRRALALVAAREGAADEAAVLSDEAREIAEGTDWLTFRGETLEDVAVVRRPIGDLDGEAEALGAALALYLRKGNVVGAERVRSMLAEVAHPTTPPSGGPA